ncbi:MAG: dockerin type I repeat-containing protein [Oscillospiraceae bacterium]
MVRLKRFQKVLSLAMVLVLFSALAMPAMAATRSGLGYVTVSLIDRGERDPAETGLAYPQALGVIVAPTRVAIQEGDTMASVTLRLLESRQMTETHTGRMDSGFYLKSIGDFTAGGQKVNEFGEFSAGNRSGWMASFNNWFIPASVSEFLVEDEDIIRWQYTCQDGADIGCDWANNQSAQITGLHIDGQYGTLTPQFDVGTVEYTLTVPKEIHAIKLEAEQANYWAKVTYRVGDMTYQLLRDIPVKNGVQIVVESAFCREVGQTPVDTDRLVITVTQEGGITTARGDVNGDGSIESLDVTMALRYVVKKLALSEQKQLAADVNGDTMVDSLDVTLLQRYVVKKIPAFPAAG